MGQYIMPQNVKYEGKTEIFPGIGAIEIGCLVLALVVSGAFSLLFASVILKIIIVALSVFLIGFLTYGTTKGISLLLILLKVISYYRGQQRYDHKGGIG